MAEVGIAVVTSDDWRMWRELRLTALAEAPYAFTSRLADWQGQGDREQRWRARLDIPGSHNVVAMLDGRPVGMASGVPASERGVADLISLWVDPMARGRGIGDRLVDAVTQWASTMDARVLRLSVAEGNDRAAALYQRHGFAFTGELGGPMSDGVRRERVMTRTLRAPSAGRG